MIKKLISLSLLGALTMLFTSCSQMPTFESFKNKSPKIDIKDYFNGEMDAYGFIQDRSGEVTRRFNVKIVGSWSGNTGTLTEVFVFDDGKKQERVWTLNVNDDGSFTGTAADVIGVAKGRQEGSAINMKYVLRIPVDGTEYDISINDWLIRMDEKRLINISSLTKFGFNVGRLTIFFEKK